MPGGWYYVLLPADILFLFMTIRLFCKDVDLKNAMLPVLILGSLRLNAYLCHQIYLCDLTPGNNLELSFSMEMMYAWFVLFNIMMYLYLLFFTSMMKALFASRRPVRYLASFLGLCGTCLLLAGIIMIFQKFLTFKMGIIIITGLIPIAIIYALYYYKNQAVNKFFHDTEERTRQNYKFEACFDNLNESIILVSNGQIEYVNSSFLQQFMSSIKTFSYLNVDKKQKSDTTFKQKFMSIFKTSKSSN